MITIEQRIELLRGGYTPAQIEGFDNEPQPAQQEVQPEAQPAKQPEKQPEAQPEYSNADVMKELASLKSMIQAQNIAGSFIPQVDQKDAAAVLAEVIRPERKV